MTSSTADTDEATLKILRTLLAAEDGFVSGNTLADTLGVSRVSVWGRMEKMREHGFAFEAVTRRGYRIVKKPDALNPWLIQAYLPENQETPNLVCLESIDSTNSHATRLLAHDHSCPLFVVSNEQTKGRGRMGRTWFSPPSSNLYLSFACRPEVPWNRMQLFTLWMGVCLADKISTWLGSEVGVKWPNDLYAQERKLAGMLTEARVDADRIRELVFGLGLNVNQSATDWPEDIQNQAISLRELAGKSLDLNKVAAELILAIQDGYQQFHQDDMPDQLADLWKQYDVLYGREVEAEIQGQRTAGTARGIDDSGNLLIKDTDQNWKSLNAGEVHLSKSWKQSPQT